MICSQCGGQVPEGKKFCPLCGAPQAAPAVNKNNVKKSADSLKKRKNVVPVIVTSVLFLAASATTGILAYKYHEKKQDDIKYYKKLAERNMEEFKYEEAIAAYNDLIELDPAFAEAYTNMAEMYKAQNKYYDARAILNQGIDSVSGDDAEDLEDALDEVQAVIDTPVSLSGVVTEAEFGNSYGNPTGGVTVTVHSTDELRDEEYTASTVTGPDGYYSFDDLTVGNYEITFEGNDSIGTTQQYEVYAGSQEAYNSVVQVIPSLYAGSGTASGRIVSATNGDQGVSDLVVDIREGYNNLDGDVISTCDTDSYGYYYTDNLSAGCYTLNFHTDVDSAVDVDDEDEDEDEDYISGFINICIFGNHNNENQNGSISSSLAAGQMRVVLTWGATPSDLDSHLFCALDNGDCGHVYFSNQEFNSYTDDGYVAVADLDWDDTDSYGPETVSIYQPEPGIYTYGVFDYSRNSDMDIANSGVRVEVYMANSAMPVYVFYAPGGSGYFWEIFSYDTHTGRVSIINQMADGYDSNN